MESKENESAYVLDVQSRTKSHIYEQNISNCFDKKEYITGTKLIHPSKISGKVRDTIVINENKLALVTTDRQSGFDRMLAHVPYKGQVLNLTSAFWFRETSSIISNHLISVPHPNVSIVKKCIPFPIEFVVRAYMTGSTSTSIWKHYSNGSRLYCGHALPDGMKKNQKLPKILLTPTTKCETHDEPISADDIIKRNIMTQSDFDVCAEAALKVFQRGQDIASQHGLILVDTKYEMGKDLVTGEILLIDEVHTPDSSRYWLSSSYEERLMEGKEPENIDKEFFRLWFAKQCDPYKDEILPKAPKELVVELSRRYISLYEMITGKEFCFDDSADCSFSDAESMIMDVIQKEVNAGL